MNLLRGKQVADYVNTGEWSKKAIGEAKRYCKRQRRRELARTRNFTYVPQAGRVEARPGRRLRAHTAPTKRSAASSSTGCPTTGDVPLVADMSSHILSRPIDVAQFGADLRRRAEEHRPRGPHDRDRARRPDRPSAAGHADGVRLQAAGGERLDAQHAADVCDLHRRARVRVAERTGRARGDGRA